MSNKTLVLVMTLSLLGACGQNTAGTAGSHDSPTSIDSYAANEAMTPSAVPIPAGLTAPSRPTGGEFTSVTDTFGALKVNEGETEAAAPTKAWSSWWYPLWENRLFETRPDGTMSTLQKYDFAVQRGLHKPNPGAAAFERENLYQGRAPTWAGLCDAWALASIMEKEPKSPITFGGTTFQIDDQKALLLKTYDAIQNLKHYGQRNDGKWDSVFEDIYPEQFHRYVQVMLFERKRPFIMDYDPGIEVWNTPAYRAQFRIKKDASDARVMHVEAWIFTAGSDVEEVNFVGTKEIVRSYTYDLYGTAQTDGGFLVAYGLWTGRSRWDHPDYVIEKPDSVVRKAMNTRIDPKIVDMILRGGMSLDPIGNDPLATPSSIFLAGADLFTN